MHALSRYDKSDWAVRMPTLQLQNEDARIVALAIRYHLARPGSETDSVTLQRRDDGLLSVDQALVPLLANAVVHLNVTPYQLHRIDEGLLGVTNELKAYEMSRRQSVVPRFAETLGTLFPGLAADAPATSDDGAHEDALDLVERVVALRRRLAAAVRDAREAMEREQAQVSAAAAEARRAARPWWRFWG